MLKNAILTAFYGKNWYWMMAAWLEFLKVCVSVPDKHYLTIFWLNSMFLSLQNILNSEKRHFYGILWLFTAFEYYTMMSAWLEFLQECLSVLNQHSLTIFWLDSLILSSYNWKNAIFTAFYGFLWRFLKKIPTEFFISGMVTST